MIIVYSVKEVLEQLQGEEEFKSVILGVSEHNTLEALVYKDDNEVEVVLSYENEVANVVKVSEFDNWETKEEQVNCVIKARKYKENEYIWFYQDETQTILIENSTNNIANIEEIIG